MTDYVRRRQLSSVPARWERLHPILEPAMPTRHSGASPTVSSLVQQVAMMCIPDLPKRASHEPEPPATRRAARSLAEQLARRIRGSRDDADDTYNLNGQATRIAGDKTMPT